ncbi:hypothetical protein GCM10023231_25900 [Olivibacter ginsenosidimutans]|uniref:Universal stress protein n=1 Tax=Olivibacter ginsenosidimutans TaxID=1176537 RepID=A0ABP9BJF1_9SPHI
MKKILIPIDFSAKSLDILTDYVLATNVHELDVLFFSGIKLSDSITDLLLLSRRTKEVERIPASFENYCKCIQQEFKTISRVRFIYFYGNTLALFRNFLAAQEIDEIVYDPTLKLKRITKLSLDTVDMIDKLKWTKWTPDKRKPQIEARIIKTKAIETIEAMV